MEPRHKLQIKSRKNSTSTIKPKRKANKLVITKPWLKTYVKNLKTLLNHPKLIRIAKLESFRIGGSRIAVHGWYEAVPSRNFIRISLDYRRELFPTLIHESLHHFYPKMRESQVAKHERRIINYLTNRQVKDIIKKLAQNI